MNVYRKRFSTVVMAFALISFIVCGFMLICGFSEDFDLLTFISWGRIATAPREGIATDAAVQFEPETLHLGVSTS